MKTAAPDEGGSAAVVTRTELGPILFTAYVPLFHNGTIPAFQQKRHHEGCDGSPWNSSISSHRPRRLS